MHSSSANVKCHKRLRRWALAGVVVLLVQISLGGWTSSNYAAFACPELPTCQEQWWPAMDFPAGFNLMQDVGPNYLGGLMDNDARVAIHMSHRIGAIVTTLYLLGLVLAVARTAKQTVTPMLGKLAGVLLIALLAQVLLGISNVLWHLPLPVAVAHNAGGALLLLALITINYYLFSAAATVAEEDIKMGASYA